MISLAVVDKDCAELTGHLRKVLPEGVALHGFSGQGDPASEVLGAEIALGAPDLLAPLLPAMPQLRWVQSTWAGVTPFLACPRRDYRLSGVKGLFGRSMAEYVLGWMLALRRSILRHASAQQWDGRADAGLSALRVGIAGVGSIGSEVARRCAPFVEEVRGLNSDGRSVDGCHRCYGIKDRLLFARNLDVLVLLLPSTQDTTHVADGALLDELAEGAIVINAGRANALATAEALTRLETKALSAMVLDVLDREPLPAEDPLWQVPGVYITSHTAAPTGAREIVELFRDNLLRYLAGEEPDGLIDFERGY